MSMEWVFQRVAREHRAAFDVLRAGKRASVPLGVFCRMGHDTGARLRLEPAGRSLSLVVMESSRVMPTQPGEIAPEFYEDMPSSYVAGDELSPLWGFPCDECFGGAEDWRNVHTLLELALEGLYQWRRAGGGERACLRLA